MFRNQLDAQGERRQAPAGGVGVDMHSTDALQSKKECPEMEKKTKSHRELDGWMDGWMDGWINGVCPASFVVRAIAQLAAADRPSA